MTCVVVVVVACVTRGCIYGRLARAVSNWRDGVYGGRRRPKLSRCAKAALAATMLSIISKPLVCLFESVTISCINRSIHICASQAGHIYRFPNPNNPNPIRNCPNPEIPIAFSKSCYEIPKLFLKIVTRTAQISLKYKKKPSARPSKTASPARSPSVTLGP